MTIKAIIIDASETMLKRSESYQVVNGITDMIAQLRKRNITLFTASNNFPEAYAVTSKLNIDKDNILYSDMPEIDGKKGKRKFVQYVCSRLNISSNELIYLGDSQYDCNEAVNSNVAFFLANWANPTIKYGIPIETPSEFVKVIETFFLKDDLWYYSIDDKDSLGRNVTVRSLLDPDKPGIKDLLKSKGLRGPKTLKGFKSSTYLSLHLFASVYLEGLHLKGEGRKLTWCMYPGHKGDYEPILDDFVKMISMQFHEQYVQDLILRHREAKHTSSIRYRISIGKHSEPPPTMDNQLQTIQLNLMKKKNITDRTIIVIDDFTTDGYSFETARNFLLNASAKSVICICVGKYPKTYLARSPKDGIKWDSFSPALLLTENGFNITAPKSVINYKALKTF